MGTGLVPTYNALLVNYNDHVYIFLWYIFRYIFPQNPGYNRALESDNLDALQCKNGITKKRTYCGGWSSDRDYTPLCDLRYRRH